MIRFLAIYLTLMAHAAIPVQAQSLSRCTADGAEAVQVASVNDRLEIKLADGRLIALAGIETPESQGAAGAARTLLDSLLIGQPVGLHAIAAKPDRWGRLAGLLYTDAPVAETLLQAGVVRIRAIAPLACLHQLRAAETAARDNGEGLWAKQATAMIDATDTEAFTGKNGAYVVVEGDVFSINATDYRTYINFGPRRYGDFAITILKPILKIFDKAGLSVQSLRGRKIRVRGMVDMRFGPQIEVSNPDAIEILGEAMR